jgi:tetratricopeptide (TPR) repeat protein
LLARISGKGNAIEQSKAYYWRGHHFITTRELDRAIDDFTMAIKLSPTTKGYPTSLAYNERGLIFWQAKGELDRAITDVTEAIRLDPQPVFYLNRGIIFLQQKDITKAYADFSDAMRLNPTFAQAYAWRGRSYQMAGQFDDAIGDEDDAIRLDSELPIAYAFRGLAYEGKGERELALADFDRALAINPNVILAREARDRVRSSLPGR